jgi:hypothetical protein
MTRTMTTKRDLRNWVDDATSGWWERTDADVDAITNAIQADNHPAWGTDWSAYLDALPELTELLPAVE